MKKIFILYDGRGKSGDTSEASIYDVAESEKEVQEINNDYNFFSDSIWYEYDDDKGTLINEKARWDLSPK